MDDIDRRFTQAGILGFSPRDFEAAQAFLLYQRGWSKAKIRKSVMEIGRYGLGRTAAEKSANFVFFPFSFAKKLAMSLGDFVLQAPARALLLHEGLRRYEESGLNERVGEFLERHAPLLQQLKKINNLAYGLSPGRFFLDGLDDNKTNVGKVMQILTSVFVPSGAATPLAQAAGGVGDLAVHAFVPVVVTGEEIDGLDDIATRYIPFIRDLGQFWEAGAEQVTALTEGATPWAQFQDYTDSLREKKRDLDPLAVALGYVDADGLMASVYGDAFRQSYEQHRMELFDKYPTGAKMAQSFESSALTDQKALLDLAEKAEKTAAEEAILELVEKREGYVELASILGLSREVVAAMATQPVREAAMRYAKDRGFVELWDRFLAREFGPISRVA